VDDNPSGQCVLKITESVAYTFRRSFDTTPIQGLDVRYLINFNDNWYPESYVIMGEGMQETDVGWFVGKVLDRENVYGPFSFRESLIVHRLLVEKSQDPTK
jgi:hypothetical protein